MLWTLEPIIFIAQQELNSTVSSASQFNEERFSITCENVWKYIEKFTLFNSKYQYVIANHVLYLSYLL